jgi:hypothetical protein
LKRENELNDFLCCGTIEMEELEVCERGRADGLDLLILFDLEDILGADALRCDVHLADSPRMPLKDWKSSVIIEGEVKLFV